MKEPESPTNSWGTATLGDLSEVKSGVGFPKKYQGQSSGNYPVYKVGDVSRAVTQGQGLLNAANHYVTTEEAGALKGAIFRAGSTLFAKIGEAVKLNRRAFIMRPGLADNNVMAVVPYLNESDRYLYYFLRTVDLSDVSRSTTVPSVRKGDIEDLEIPLPPLAEQKVIADKLDTLLAQVDNTKARLERIPQILKRFRQSVLAAAVSGRLTEEWRDKRSLERFGDITWEDILRDKKTSFKRGPFGSALKKSIFVESGYKVYEQYCPINDDCSFARYYITPEKFEELKAFEVRDGDFLISCSGVSLGRITQVPVGSEPGVINQALLRVRLNNHVYDDEFFKLVFRSPEFQKAIFANSTGSAIPNLKGVKELKAMQLPYPSLAEQTEIVRRVDQLFAHADRTEQQVNNALARVNNLTQSILAKAFRGELTEQWRKDNPELISGENSAEVLLERIKTEREAIKSKRQKQKA